MKHSAFVLAAALIAASSTVVAQGSDPSAGSYFSRAERYKSADLTSIERNYVMCLGSENDGVVESAIAQATRMKMAVPGKGFERIKAALGCLSVNGRTASIRYKAYLAGLLFDDPALFARESERSYGSVEELFLALSGRLQSALIGYNDRKYVRPE